MALHPLKCIPLIEKSIVSATLSVRKKSISKKANTVRNVDGDDGFLLSNGVRDKAGVVK
jgi:hypothetical protein